MVERVSVRVACGKTHGGFDAALRVVAKERRLLRANGSVLVFANLLTPKPFRLRLPKRVHNNIQGDLR